MCRLWILPVGNLFIVKRLGCVTNYTYDACGNLIQTIDALGNSKTRQSNVVAADIRTGDVYIGVKDSRVYKGNATCAEDIVFRGLGGNTNANIII